MTELGGSIWKAILENIPVGIIVADEVIAKPPGFKFCLPHF